jgi:hypothetical protein
VEAGVGTELLLVLAADEILLLMGLLFPLDLGSGVVGSATGPAPVGVGTRGPLGMTWLPMGPIGPMGPPGPPIAICEAIPGPIAPPMVIPGRIPGRIPCLWGGM